MMFKGVGKKAIAVLTAGLFFAMGFSYVPTFAVTAADVALGASANRFALISGGPLTIEPDATFAGDLPTSKGATLTLASVVSGITTLSLQVGNAAASDATTEVKRVYDLIVPLTPNFTSIDPAATSLTAGIYRPTGNAALNITSTFTLNGQNNPNAVFIFMTGGALGFDASVNISCINGTQPRNVYWVSTGATTIGANATVCGNVISLAASTVSAGVRVNGAVLGLDAVTFGSLASINHIWAAPNVPTAVSALAGNAQVELAWQAPTPTSSSAITDFLVEYSTDGSTYTPFAHTPSTTTSSTVTGLVNGTPYNFRVSAINLAGTGAPSLAAPATPRTTPGAPTSLATITGNAQTLLTWIAPSSNGGSAITGYTVTSSPPITAPAGCLNTSTLSCSFTGLTNGTSYTFTVVALNTAGSSDASTPASATPSAPAPVPTAEEIENARLASLEFQRLEDLAAENARIAAATAEAARLAEIARAAAAAAENARIAAATAEAARLAEIARAAAVEAARLAAIEAERARLAEIARLLEVERIANCNTTISNIKYSAAAPGSAFGHLSWTHTGNGVFQYFGDTFLYPAFMQYGVYSAEWKGYLINLVPGVRYQVSVNYLSDCGQISGVSMSIMNEKEVALVVPTPTATPTPIPSPAPSLVIQIPIPSVTKPPAPIELVQPVKTGAAAPVVTVQGIAFKTVTIKAISQSRVHVVLHNLIPGQKVSITLRTVKP